MSTVTWVKWLLCLYLFPTLSNSQAFHTVTVGDTGSFYDPPTTSALQGDVITFIFTGKSHSVTQSSFNSPCTRLQGGFDSDSVGVKNAGDPVPYWNLTITNDTQPIWFYCKNTLPLSHCTSGMVGAINPPTGTAQNYTAFRQAAKAITGTPVPTPGAVLTGVGASASGVPVLITTNVGSSSAPSSSSSSSSPSSSSSSIPPTAAVSSSGLSAAKVGGAVGGALGGVIVIGIIVLVVLARRRRQTTPKDVFPSRDMYHNDGSTVDNRSISWAPYNTQNDFIPVADGNRHTASSVHSPADSTHQQVAHSSLAFNPDGAPATPLSSMGNANVRELAAEIASLMKSNGTSLTAIDENQTASASTRTSRPLPPVSQASGRNRSQETLPLYSGRDRD